MAETVPIEVPREVLRAARMTPEDLRKELAVHLYQEGKLSFGKARQLAGMNAWDFQQLLGCRGVEAHYGVEGYERDLLTARRLDQE